MSEQATVSIVLPSLNSRAFVHDCITSLLGQDYVHIVEVIIVDGGSTDGTLELVAAFSSAITVLNNSWRTVAEGLNIGTKAASGDVICRADARAVFAPDYVRRCVEALRRTGAASVGGRMRPVGTSAFGRAVAAVTSSPIVVGPDRFQYAETEQDVDAVYLGCWERSVLVAAGGFDESDLQSETDDRELNERLRQQGRRVVFVPGIHSWSFPRESLSALCRQYRDRGSAEASTLVKHRRLRSMRLLAPPALVLATAGLLVTPRTRHLGPVVPLAHALVVATAVIPLARRDGVAPERAFTAIEICHWSFGVGFWKGLIRATVGRQSLVPKLGDEILNPARW